MDEEPAIQSRLGVIRELAGLEDLLSFLPNNLIPRRFRYNRTRGELATDAGFQPVVDQAYHQQKTAIGE